MKGHLYWERPERIHYSDPKMCACGNESLKPTSMAMVKDPVCLRCQTLEAERRQLEASPYHTDRELELEMAE